MTSAENGGDAPGVKSAAKNKASAPKMTPAEEAWDLAKTVFFAVAIALVLRVIIFQPFNIPSGSMKPTLLVGDFLVVSKPTFGYSKASLVYPLTRLPVEGRILQGGSPARGDVIVFKNKRDRNRDYIKRVIGLPGDQIQMIGGRLTINNEMVPKELIGKVDGVCDGYAGLTYRETLDNGVSYLVQECSGDKGALDNVGPYQVPAGHYFMMGDNRDNSQDSRTPGVSYIPEDAIVGRAERLFFSVDGEKTKLWTVWNWPFAIRYGRILHAVE